MNASMRRTYQRCGIAIRYQVRQKDGAMGGSRLQLLKVLKRTMILDNL